MLVIPAIDLKEGRCVRLQQGRMDQQTVYSDDPAEVARRWAEAGARRLHVVDLDGAASGEPRNAAAIRAIIDAVPDVEVQVGGGIRDEDGIAAYLDAGARFVILGTRAVTAPHFVSDACMEFPGHILVGLDVRDGRVAIDGWSKLSRHSALELAQQFEQEGVDGIVYTDIARDGMLSGVNAEATAAFAGELAVPVIASGGVEGLDDIRALCEAAGSGIAGVITGKALYEGRLDLAEAQRLADELAGAP